MNLGQASSLFSQNRHSRAAVTNLLRALRAPSFHSRPTVNVHVGRVAISTCLGLLLAGEAKAEAQPPPSPAEEAEACLACHGDDSLTKTFADGQSMSLQVHGETLAGSVHKQQRCTSCHPGMAEVPHAERTFTDFGHWQTEWSKVCASCHQDIHMRVAQGVHGKPAVPGKTPAPTCIRCHGSHDIQPPGKPRTRISAVCATCHPGIAAEYAKSVHGRALFEEGNADVPVCTDCHRAHEVESVASRKRQFAAPKVCGRCHADEKVMKKYGLSTAVLSSYFADFHGTTTTFGPSKNPKQGQRIVATCPDCHGLHDIRRVRDPSSSVFRDNLVKTCRQCHDEATASFPAAWLKHYEPTLAKAPVVFFVKRFYQVIIPLIVGGLLLQIVLHLRRRSGTP